MIKLLTHGRSIPLALSNIISGAVQYVIHVATATGSAMIETCEQGRGLLRRSPSQLALYNPPEDANQVSRRDRNGLPDRFRFENRLVKAHRPLLISRRDSSSTAKSKFLDSSSIPFRNCISNISLLYILCTLFISILCTFNTKKTATTTSGYCLPICA